MAFQGLSKVQAVSRMLMSIGQNRVTSLDTSGTSDAADAEIYLDEVTSEFIIAGKHPSCIRRHVSVTANASGIVVINTVAPNALRVVGAGKYQRREFVIRDGNLYDPTDGVVTGASFANGETITVDIHEAPDSSSPGNFEKLDPSFKIDITKEACIRFAASKKPDQLRDSLLIRERNQHVAAMLPVSPNIPDYSGRILNNPIGAQNNIQQIPNQ